MKLVNIFILFFIIPLTNAAQEITYSEYNNEDDKNINFEIIGKMNDSYIIYKNIRWKHMLAIYDNDMKFKKSIRLKFVPDKTFNIDFIPYPDHFYIIYQYQKNNTIYCKAVKMDAEGNKITEPVVIDTTQISLLAENKIYSTVYSQDKKRILIYKMPIKNQKITLASKLFDAELNLLDSTRIVDEYDSRLHIYGDFNLDNDGNLFYVKQTRGNLMANIESLDIIFKSQGKNIFKTLSINLKNNYIDEPFIKIDNINKRVILNAFFYAGRTTNIKGLFSTIIDAVKLDTIISVFNEFPDSIRSKVNSDGQFRAAFDNFFIRQAIVKKDGGFILTTEDYFSQTRSNPNNNWNRSNYLYNSYYNPSDDFYMANSPFNYYRPSSGFNNWLDVRFYYDYILVISIDSKLNIEWNTIIPKNQTDDENDNFLSFSTLNVGAEIHFFYNEGIRRQIISNQSIFPNGELKRYPTVKSREAGYEFMPRFAKQVGYREVIIPCVYRSNIAFAKVIF